MIHLDVLWCSATNIFCLFPTWLSMKKRLSEGVLYFLTGLTSFFYHLHHRDSYNKPYTSYLDYNAIKYTDLILSDLCIYWVVADHRIKQFILFSILPFEIFIVVSGYPYIRLGSEIIWVILNIFYIFFKKIEINKIYFYLAITSSFIEVIFYEVLTSKYPEYYNWIHGVHHIFGFLSIYFYMQKDLITEELNKKHRRVFSFENFIL